MIEISENTADKVLDHINPSFVSELRNYALLGKYKANLAKYLQSINANSIKHSHIKVIISAETFQQFIAASFIWKKSEEDMEFWYAVSNLLI